MKDFIYLAVLLIGIYLLSHPESAGAWWKAFTLGFQQ